MLFQNNSPFEFGGIDHCILFIHGWTSTPSELQPLALKISQNGKYYCKGILLPGHGTSPQDLTDILWEQHLDYVLGVLQDLSKKYDKISIVGSSFGAVLAMNAALKVKIQNLVLISPFVAHKASTMGLPNSWLIKIVPSFILKFISKGIGTISAESSHASFFSYDKMPLKALKSIFTSTENIININKQIDSSVLIIHNLYDRVSDISGSFDLMKNLRTNDKLLRVLNNSSHSPLFDPGHSFLEDEILNWLNCR